MSRDDSEVVDLYAICARATASPVGDLRPPDLYSVAPPLTSDISAESGSGTFSILFAKKSRAKLAVVAGAAVFLVTGLLFVAVRGGTAEPAKATAAIQLAPPAPLPSAVVEAPIATPVAPAIHLPPPPTTGAPAVTKPPPRAQAVAKSRAPAAPSGPKMTKIQSTGVVGR